MTDVELCELNPELALLYNAEFAKQVSEIANLLSIKFIHVSTDHYENSVPEIKSENSEIVPVNVYSKTKLMGDVSVINSNDNAIVLRTNFFGWGCSWHKSYIQDILKGIHSKGYYEAFQDVFFTPVSINELWRFIILVIDVDFSGLLNISSSEVVSKSDFALLLCKSLDLPLNSIRPCKISENPKVTAPRPRNMSLSNKLMCEITGFKPNSISDMITQVVTDKAWQRKIIKTT
jgi:dTDP-4-dehydrorhamnose reductase